MQCLKCGGSGKKLDNTKCECGAEYKEETTLTDIEIYVPELYRGQSDFVGEWEIVVGDLEGNTLKDFINVMVDRIPNHPSIFLDVSGSQVGAYEVYFALLEKIINKYQGLPENINKMIWVNEMNTERFENCNRGIGEGRVDCFNYIISDFSLEKYEGLNNWVKIFKPRDISKLKPYPLNMYHLVVKTTGGY